MLSNDKLVILSKWRKTSVENIERGRVAIINRKDVNEIVHCQLKLPITIDGRRDVVEDSCYQPSNSSGVARATRRNAFWQLNDKPSTVSVSNWVNPVGKRTPVKRRKTFSRLLDHLSVKPTDGGGVGVQSLMQLIRIYLGWVGRTARWVRWIMDSGHHPFSAFWQLNL